MKIKLLQRKGANKAGSVVDMDDTSAAWLIEHGYAEEAKEKPKADDDKGESPAPVRRGRPPKAQS